MNQIQDTNNPTRPWIFQAMPWGLCAGMLLLGWFANCATPPDLRGFPCGKNEACPPQLKCINNICQNLNADNETPSTDDNVDSPDSGTKETTTEKVADEKTSDTPATRDEPTARDTMPEPPRPDVPPTMDNPPDNATKDQTQPADRQPPVDNPPMPEPVPEPTPEPRPEPRPEPKPEPPADTGPVQCQITPPEPDGQCKNNGHCCLNDCALTKEAVVILGITTSPAEYHCACSRDQDCAPNFKCEPNPFDPQKFACVRK